MKMHVNDLVALNFKRDVELHSSSESRSDCSRFESVEEGVVLETFVSSANRRAVAEET